MSQELELKGLEEAAVVTETKAKKAKKELTAEEITALELAVEKVKEFGVSDEYAQLMRMVPLWHDTAANAAVKQEVVDFFGDASKLKDYVDGPFQEEHAVVGGLGKVFSTMNTIKAFYARRENTGTSTKKVKLQTLRIDGEVYTVSADYLAEIAELPKDEKKSLLLAHPVTKVAESIESL